MRIGDYEPASPFVTTGSGNARWCVARKNGKQYFLKQFLAPVQPVQTSEIPTQQVLERRKRCADFERGKIALYGALKRLHGSSVVRVDDFFVDDGHYFAASEYLGLSYQTLDILSSLENETAERLLYSLAVCLRAVHEHGIVHADLKPEHIVIERGLRELHVRLIDFDSGFLESSPPDSQGHIEIDPVYLSPEAYLLMTGKSVRLNRKLDTFAFGILMHQALTGEMPRFDKSSYAYLYACVLNGGWVALSPKLDPIYRPILRRMLSKNPARRPGDKAICKALKPRAVQER